MVVLTNLVSVLITHIVLHQSFKAVAYAEDLAALCQSHADKSTSRGIHTACRSADVHYAERVRMLHTCTLAVIQESLITSLPKLANLQNWILPERTTYTRTQTYILKAIVHFSTSS